VIFYLDPLELSVREVCIIPEYIIEYYQWKRLFLAAIYHANEIHVYYNNSSFLWKGRTLENLVGSWHFAWMIVIFTFLSHVLLVASSYVLAEYFDQYDLMYTCTIGFSGVLFALKVVLNHLNPEGNAMVLGMIPVKMKHLAWAELVLIHVLVPGSSFLGHLCGIIVGTAYIYHLLDPIFAIPNAFSPALANQRDNGNGRERYYERQQYDQYQGGRRRIVNGVLY